MQRAAAVGLVSLLAIVSLACATRFISVTGAAPGGTASATVQTTPNAYCTIDYYTPIGTHSTAQGLEPKNADPQGVVTWSWRIGANTTPGDGQVIVTCNGNQTIKSGIHIG